MNKEAIIIISIAVVIIIGVVVLMALGPNQSGTVKTASQSALLDNAIHMTGK